MGQGPEMKVSIDEKLGSLQARRQIVFPPNALRGAGKDCFGMGAVAAPLLSTPPRDSRTRSLIRIVSSLCALLRGVEG
jgi:hypothetical protein